MTKQDSPEGTQIVDPDEEFDHEPFDDPLSLEPAGPARVDVYLRPAPLFEEDGETEGDRSERVRLLRIDVAQGRLTMFPRKNLHYTDRQIRPKYDSVKRISFSDGDVLYYAPSEELATGGPANTATTSERPGKGRFLGSSFGKTIEGSVPIPVPDIEETIPRSPDDVRNLLNGLPPYCVKDPFYGLGFKRAYRAVVHTIEELSVAEEIEISRHTPTAYDAARRLFVISEEDMLEFKRAVDRVNRTTRKAANTINDTSTYNKVADVLGVPRKILTYGKTKERKALTAIGNDERPLSDEEQVELVEVMTRNVDSILKADPVRMENLESGIAIAKTRSLFESLSQMIEARCSEPTWQRFLQENPFVLSMVFGRPIVKIADQASVGGQKISGSGGKIADFLVRNALTGNAALVEIKTPRAKLLNEKPYRAGVYTPSRELTGAISQVLDQRSKFEQEIASIRQRDRTLEA